MNEGTNTNNLANLLDKAQGSRTLEQWAYQSDVSASTISRCKAGKSRLTKKTIQKLSQGGLRNGVTEEQLMKAAGLGGVDFQRDILEIKEAVTNIWRYYGQATLEERKMILNAFSEENLLQQKMFEMQYKRAGKVIEGMIRREMEEDSLVDSKTCVTLTKRQLLQEGRSGISIPDIRFEYWLTELDEDIHYDEEEDEMLYHPTSMAWGAERDCYFLFCEERQSRNLNERLEAKLRVILFDHKQLDDDCFTHLLEFFCLDEEMYSLCFHMLSGFRARKDLTILTYLVDVDKGQIVDTAQVEPLPEEEE